MNGIMNIWFSDKNITYLAQKVENLKILAVMREFLKIAKEFIQKHPKNFLF